MQESTIDNTGPKYPIYSFEIYWHQKDIHQRRGKMDKNLPEGRIWNSISFRKMYKEEPSYQEINLMLINWWDELKKKKRYGKNRISQPSTPVMKWRLLEYETWCLEWFTHYTFDVGQSDEEALASFEHYVNRKIEQAEREGKEPNLMGAEDRWRWHGQEPDGKPENNSPPPCRCKYCKEQGVIRIGH